MKQVVYLQKRGTLQSHCVFVGDMLCENPDMDPITEAEHKALIKQREKIGLAEQEARRLGYANVAQQVAAEKAAKLAAEEAKKIEAKAKKAKAPAKPKAPAQPKAKGKKKGKKGKK